VRVFNRIRPHGPFFVKPSLKYHTTAQTGKTKPVAVIGAGISGLSCAQALREAGVDTRVFENAPVVGGRCATRLWQGHLVDTGIQYFTAQTNEFKKELLTRLRQFRPIISPILDRDSKQIKTESGPRFYVLQGNHYFAHLLSQRLDLCLDTPVERVTFNATGAECLGDKYRAVVSSLPGPLTARLFGLSRSPVEYDPCLVALLEYSGTGLGTSRQCYARLLTGGKDGILFSSCENNKAGRIIGDKTVFVVQASPRFSREYAGDPPETWLPLLAQEHENLWHLLPAKATASFGHRWLHARPREDDRQRVDLPKGAFLCGDSLVESDMESVWLDGQRAARDVLAYLADI